MKIRHWLAALALAASSAQALANSATVLRNETLRATPAATGKAVVNVNRGAAVTVLAKQGGWVKVRAAGRDGWVRLLSVRAGAGGLPSSGVGAVVGAATTRANPSKVVAVAGLRGLDDGDLKGTHFDAAQMDKLDSLAASSSQARSFASKAGLATTKVSSLPNPAKSAEPAPAQAW